MTTLKQNCPNASNYTAGNSAISLNAICPYYTMYPIDFPLRVLGMRARSKEWVLDPYCGRGTTNFAARILGLPSVGIDTSPIAVAIAKAKLVGVSPEEVIEAAKEVLVGSNDPRSIPQGEFWRWAYDKETLRDLCRLREALMEDCYDPPRIMLRAIILGALHGPVMKGEPSYFSNQCTRTFAPKPTYAVRFWKKRNIRPPRVDVLNVIRRKATYFLTQRPGVVDGFIIQADSRRAQAFDLSQRFSWVITSPPYYGMRTYIPDQWLRGWFLGGPTEVAYGQLGGLAHGSPEEFVAQLAEVWRNVASVCVTGAKLVCRFGGINDRKQEPITLLKRSFLDTGWRITTLHSAGTALNGKRQAVQFGQRVNSKPRKEYDLYAMLKD